MSTQKADSLTYEEVRFLGIPALFTSLRVSGESVPEGMYRYELRHDEDTCEPCQAAKKILVNHYGTLLTSKPIQLPADGYLCFKPKDLVFQPHGGCGTLEAFQRSYPPEQEDVLELFPMEPEQARLFFSCLDKAEDKASGCIGHLRGDFDSRLYTTWWPHYWDGEYNNDAFKQDIQRVMDWLRAGFAPLKDLKTMDAFCQRYENCRIPGQEERCYGFRIESGRYRYMLRCTPLKGYYHVYLYCYRKDIAPGEEMQP